MKTIFSSVFAMGAALALHGGERLFTMDMVHHNPGDKPTESRFLDPAYLAEMGSGAKVVNDFRYPQCACTFEEFDAEIFPAGSPERKWVDDFAAEVEAKARDCHEKGLECHYFMDIIVLPRRLIEKYRSEICGEDGRVSFEREKTWEIHRLMIREMLRRIPSVDGYVIRTGEMYSHNVPYHGGNTPLDFRKPLDGFVDTHAKLMNLLREEICVKGGKKVFYRTWDFRRFHIRPDLYLAITDQVEPHEKLFLSIKHTAGDYLRYVPFNPTLGIGKHKQIVEVQCQREYEGKGAYPNYVVKGVVEGFEENAACPGIQGLGEFLKDSRFAGVWTWSRGGGWEGPYLKNELWCAMNAFVMTEWANHPEAGEEVAFGKFMDRIGVAAESRDAFHKLAVLSAGAVVRGMGYMPDEKLTACWTRDHFIGGFGDPELDADANRLVKEGKVAASLANRRAAVERWREIVRLADSVKIADKAAESYVRVSSRYGLHLYRIYEAGWTAMLLMRQRELTGKADEGEIAAAVKRYDEAWRDYRALAADPQCATLFDGHFAAYHISQDHNSIDPVPGMDAEVRKQAGGLMVPLVEYPGEVGENAGWKCVGSEEGKVVYIPFEGYYESKGGRIESPRFKLDGEIGKNRFYRLTFSAKCPVDGYWWVDFFDANGSPLPDVNSRLYASEDWMPYDVMVPASPDAAFAQIAFVTKKGAQAKDVSIRQAMVAEAVKWCSDLAARLPKLDAPETKGAWDGIPKTRTRILSGKPVNIVFLGDSIMNDTWCGNAVALIQDALPKADLRCYLSVRGSTGCWYYHEKDHFAEYVEKYKPDLVVIGGISNYRGPEKHSFQYAEDCMSETISRCQAIGAEVVICTPPPSYEFRKDAAAKPFDRSLILEDGGFIHLQQEYERRAAKRTGTQVWDLTTAPCEAIARSGKPLDWFKRDAAHNDDRGKQLIAQTLAAFFREVASVSK